MQQRGAWSLWSRARSGFKRMTVQETVEEKEAECSDSGLEESLCSQEEGVSGNTCCWEAGNTCSVIIAAVLLYVLACLCTVQTNNVSSLVGVWKLSTDKPPNRTEMRLNPADISLQELVHFSLGLPETLSGLRQTHRLIDWVLGHSVWGQTCWNLTFSLHLSLLGSEY